MPLTAERKQDIILSAINLTGPLTGDEQAWDAQFSQNLMKVYDLTGEGSPVAKKLDAIDGSKKFVGTVVHLGKESKTGRGMVVLKTQVNDHNPEGLETARTEITTNSPENAAFARRLRELTGHRILAFVEQQTGNGRKVRVIQHAVDLGPDSEVTEDDYEAGKSMFDKKVAR